MCHSKTQNLQQIVSHIEQYYKVNVSFLNTKSTTDYKSYRTILQEQCVILKHKIYNRL